MSFSGQIPFENPDKWQRRYLPHYDAAGIYQVLTYRLRDSLPREVVARLRETHGDNDQARRKAAETYLDAGYGSCVLRKPEVAKMVVDCWRHFHGQRYRVIAYVVMPNHVHLLILTFEGWSIESLVHSWKTWTGRRILEIEGHWPRRSLGAPPSVVGRFAFPPRSEQAHHGGWGSQVFSPFEIDDHEDNPVWQREVWDRFIRDEKHYHAAIAYIHDNPKKAGLVENAEDWPWSSKSHPFPREERET